MLIAFVLQPLLFPAAPYPLQDVDKMTWTETNRAIEAIVSAQKPYTDDSKADAFGGANPKVQNFHWWPTGREFFYSKDRVDPVTGVPYSGQILSGEFRCLDPASMAVKDLGNGGWQLGFHVTPNCKVGATDWQHKPLQGAPWNRVVGDDLILPDFGTKDEATRVGELIKHLIVLVNSGDAFRQQPAYDEAVNYFCNLVGKSANLHHDAPSGTYTLVTASAKVENGVLTITRNTHGDQPDANGNPVQGTQIQTVKMSDLCFWLPVVADAVDGPWLWIFCRPDNGHPGTFCQGGYGDAKNSYNCITVEFATEDAARSAARALSLALQLYKP